MNAIVDSGNAASRRTTPGAMHKMKWLLKREFWENKGGFLWAQVVAGVVSLLVVLATFGVAQLMLNHARNDPGSVVTINGNQVAAADVGLGQVLQNISEQDVSRVSDGINLLLLIAGGLPFLVLPFVVFFYFVGCLHDDRKDRSILFWKSLPVSDANMVGSKLVFGLLVGPLIAVAVSLAAMLLTAVIGGAFIALNGENPFTLIFPHIHVGTLLGASLSWLPIYWLWALPTVGWLMLCSAWARSVPFLWAVLIPLGLGIATAMVYAILNVISQGTAAFNPLWIWEHVVARALLGLWPGSHLAGRMSGDSKVFSDGGIHLDALISEMAGVDVYGNPALWIGAAIGIAMILLAIRLRRWRDEG